MMKPETAKELLERYFAGETSLAEESELRNYFLGEHVAPGLEQHRPLFAYWQARATAPKALPRRRRRTLPRLLAVAAAAIALLLTANVWLPVKPAVSDFPLAETQTKTIDWSKYEVTEPEAALRILHSTLKTVSTEINRAPRAAASQLRTVANSLD
ncbi:MAG: hypothetical protein AAFN92_01830 [Bacteroidota bacterium]